LLEEIIDVNIVFEQLSYAELFTTDIAVDLFAMHYKRKLDRMESLLKSSEKTKVDN
jgi:hypothetical protein